LEPLLIIKVFNKRLDGLAEMCDADVMHGPCFFEGTPGEGESILGANVEFLFFWVERVVAFRGVHAKDMLDGIPYSRAPCKKPLLEAEPIACDPFIVLPKTLKNIRMANQVSGWAIVSVEHMGL
jgi:hypothetical protein